MQPPLKLPPTLLQSLDLAGLVQAGPDRGADLFPSTVAHRAAAKSVGYTEKLERRLRRGFAPGPTEVVHVPKFGGGTRPAAELSLEMRLLWDALAQLVRSRVSSDLVNWSLEGDARDEAEAELSQGPHDYVVVTDVVSCYEYIERDRLLEELVDLTGDEDAASAVAMVLDHVAPGPRGIPQGLRSSRALGDVYLSLADRELGRSGVPVVRWVDDYRLSAGSMRDASHILSALERALRQIGLVINSAKTWIPTRDAYAGWVARHQAERNQIAETIERIRQRREVDYEAVAEGEEGPAPAVDPVLEAGFVTSIEDEANWHSSPEGYAAARRIQVSLWELGRTGSAAPLDRLETLIYRFPHLTREIAGYLRRRIRAGLEADTVEHIATVLARNDYPHDWQLGWLLHALIPAQSHLPEPAIAKAANTLRSAGVPSFARGRAAVVLATEGRLPLGLELESVYSDVAEATRPDLVAAASLMRSSPSAMDFLKAVRRDPLLDAIAEHIAETDISAI